MLSNFLLSVLIVVLACSTSFGQTQSLYPPEEFAVLQADIDGYPIFATINAAYLAYPQKQEFPWHVFVYIELKETQPGNGLPTQAEANALNALEDTLLNCMRAVGPVHYIGRTVYKGTRSLYFYVADPELVNPILQELTNDPSPIRPFGYEMVKDEAWQEVQELLDAANKR